MSNKINGTTKTQRRALRELMRAGGAVITSDWTTGAGVHTKRRALPPFCKRLMRWQSKAYPLRIQRVFNKHPRCTAVIAIVDMRAANRTLQMAPVN